MKIAFILTMPGRASWNGKWGGEDNLYAIIQSFNTIKARAKAASILAQHSFAYRWDDGWCARVLVREVDNPTARKMRKESKGFCGYGWMVESILQHGAIYASHDEIPKEAATP